jgi:hypothetical protein
MKELGEPVGVRTRDLLIKSQLLYRLSYGLLAARNIRSAAGPVNCGGPAPGPRRRYKSRCVDRPDAIAGHKITVIYAGESVDTSSGYITRLYPRSIADPFRGETDNKA